MGVLVAGGITLHALGNAVTQKSNSVKVAALHGAKGRQGGHAGIGVQVLQIYGLFHRGGCIPRGVIHGGKQALGVTRRLSGGFGLLRGCRGSSFRRGHGRLRLGGVRLLIVAGHPEKACSCTQYDQHHHQGNYRVAAAALFFYLLAVVVIISHRVYFLLLSAAPARRRAKTTDIDIIPRCTHWRNSPPGKGANFYTCCFFLLDALLDGPYNRIRK